MDEDLQRLLARLDHLRSDPRCAPRGSDPGELAQLRSETSVTAMLLIDAANGFLPLQRAPSLDAVRRLHSRAEGFDHVDEAALRACLHAAHDLAAHLERRRGRAWAGELSLRIPREPSRPSLAGADLPWTRR